MKIIISPGSANEKQTIGKAKYNDRQEQIIYNPDMTCFYEFTTI